MPGASAGLCGPNKILVEQWRTVVILTEQFVTSQYDVVLVCKRTFWRNLLTQHAHYSTQGHWNSGRAGGWAVKS